MMFLSYICRIIHVLLCYLRTLSMFYKKRRKIETSPFLSIFCWCYCSIYDVIASLLLNKPSKIELVVSYKAFLINHTECSKNRVLPFNANAEKNDTFLRAEIVNEQTAPSDDKLCVKHCRKKMNLWTGVHHQIQVQRGNNQFLIGSNLTKASWLMVPCTYF